MIKKYRKKPIIIEAIQYTGNNIDEVKHFCEKTIRFNDGNLVIGTLEGLMRVLKNDYIIKRVNGEFYPCRPDVFFKTYEEIKD